MKNVRSAPRFIQGASKDSIGESDSREYLCSDDGAFSQEYCFCISRKGDEVRTQIIREAPMAIGSLFANI